jgi:hypothetical protein
MKHALLYFSCWLAATTMISCNNQADNTTTATVQDTIKQDTGNPAENKVMVPVSGCYSWIKGKDTVLLKVDKFPNVVTGILSYNFFEKDKNNGDIDGKLHNDTLIADYKFMSEGKPSVRQVAFLLQDSAATEGYGPQEMKDEKMVFKNVTAIDFKKGIKLKKIQCAVQ